MNPTSSRLVETVVVGNVTVEDSNDAPHVIARAAVPVIAIHRVSPLFGVPLRLVVKLVMSAVCPVMTTMSKLSVLIVGVAPGFDCASTLFVTLLFVRVSVELVVTTFTPSTETFPAETRARVVSVACPSSTVPTPIALEVEAVKNERVSDASPATLPSTEICPADERAIVVSDAAPSSIVPVVKVLEVPMDKLFLVRVIVSVNVPAFISDRMKLPSSDVLVTTGAL